MSTDSRQAIFYVVVCKTEYTGLKHFELCLSDKHKKVKKKKRSNQEVLLVAALKLLILIFSSL